MDNHKCKLCQMLAVILIRFYGKKRIRKIKEIRTLG